MDFVHVILLLTALLGGCSGAPECGDSPSLLPHEDHCDRYYKCDGAAGTPPTPENCPPRWMFDIETQKCISPGDEPVDCSGRPYSDQSFKTFSRDPRPVCESGCQTQYHPHEYYCDRYYKCQSGFETLGVCPDQLYFDAEESAKRGELVCLIDAFAIMPGFHCAERPLRKAPPKLCDPDTLQYADGETCDKYTYCEDKQNNTYRCFHGQMVGENDWCVYPHEGTTYDNFMQNDKEGACDKSTVWPFQCPQIWIHPWVEAVAGFVRYILPVYFRQWGVYFWISWLQEPRVTWGHCRYFIDCPVHDDGWRKPKTSGCNGGQVVDPYTLECVHDSYAPECKDYYHKAQWAAEYRRNLTYNFY